MNKSISEVARKSSEDIVSEKQKEESEIGQKKIQSKKCLFITIISIAVAIIMIGVIVYFVIKEISKRKNKNKENKEDEEDEEEEEEQEISQEPKKPIISSPKVKEFDILTRVGDLKQISLVQKSKDETKINGKVIETKNIRKTNYNIYIISEEDPDEEHSAYYTKMYSGCISIRSECSSSSDDCQPQPLVDLTLKPKNTGNARILEDSDIIKDSPIALCYFNITDNHIITTIKCHESFPESQKNQMLLDLYFFRPPASQRIDKQGDNITLEISEDGKNIREINGGLCNIYNNFGSLCTTDMNTTLDSEKNLISYDEEAITMINYDEHNSYRKKKITNLIDASSNIKKEDIENYKNSLNILKPLLEKYMDDDIQFTDDDFADFSERYKNTSKRYIPKKTRNVFRKLDEPKYQYNQQAEIFSQKTKGIGANLKQEINPGIDSDIVGAYGTFNFDENKYTYSSIQNMSTINGLINKVASVSKAGNQLATELYDKIIDRLEQVLNEFTIQLNSLNDLVSYHDLYPIFNSTLSLYAYNKLPNDIVKVSNELLSSLSGIFTQIKSGNVKTHAQILYNDVYGYIDEINELILDMLKNFGNLTNTLITKNNTYTAITNYYSNDTSASYVNIIKNIKEILNNYFIDEYNLIFPKIENLLHTFNESTKESLKKDLASLKELYNNILNGSYTINDITNQDFQKVLSNLDNSYNYPKGIVNKINEFVLEILNLKQNGYFISDADIDNFNKTFISLISKADEVSKKLDNFPLIDKVFDEIMSKFRDNFIDTVSYMEQIKQKNFQLEEDVLNTTSFSQDIKNKMEEDIISISDDILDRIKISNNYEKIKKYLISFLDEYLDHLNYLISDLDLIFSEVKIKNLAEAFELSLNISLQRITNETDNNINLAKTYYEEFFDAINDLASLKKLVQKQMIQNPSHPDYMYSTITQMIEYDEIKEKEYTAAYLTKYNSFMANLNYSQSYLINQLYSDIVNEHREIFDAIKEYLVSILNNNLIERFSDFEEVQFFKNHIKIIDKLNIRLNKYFSPDNFDTKYMKMINDTINLNKQKMEEAKEYINDKHSRIKALHYYDKDKSNDVCIVFKRKVCYGCTNCVAYTFFYDRICFVLSPYHYNYLEVKKLDFEAMKNINAFNNIFFDFNNTMTIKIEQYNSILYNLTIFINSLSDESSEGTVKNISINYFEPLRRWINSTLGLKYQDEIVKGAYNYYHQNVKGKIGIILEDIFNKWKEIYLNLTIDVKNNINNIKYNLFEFSNIGSIYRSIITQELTENFFNSTILFQRSEFNYTISYYYKYLIKLVDKSYKYILNKILTGEYAFNDTIQERKEEIKKIYDILIAEIAYSEIHYSEIENQLNILQVNENDFFEVKYILKNNVEEIKEKLEIMIDDIADYELDIDEGDEYSLAMRYFLENKEFGKLIQKYYEPIDKEELIYLHLNKFKDIMKENWVFDEGDFIYILNKALFESNRIFKNELSLTLDNYSALIENEINKFIEVDIESIIDEQYETQFKSLTNSTSLEIQYNLNDIMDIINKRVTYEVKRFEANLSHYKLNGKKIEGIINDYKYIINNALNSSVFGVLDGFHKNMYNNIYSNCIETRLNQFLNIAKNSASSSEFGKYNMVNTSYKIGEVIYNLTETIANNYKSAVKKKLDFKYKEYYEKIKSTLILDIKYTMVNIVLSSIYKDAFQYYSVIYANCTSNICEDFDFSYETKNEINNTINKKVNNITNIISKTKGNNYNANFKCSLDFSNSGENIIKPICNEFKKFLSFENHEQSTLINEFIRSYIKSNLGDFLNNVVPTFGNSFFERIIDYNINFKIIDLYQNLRYSQAQTILYYYILYAVNDYLGQLPSDLKIRLIQLNDLDTTITIKKEQIKKLLEKKLYELIKDLKDTMKETYTYYLKENDIIKNSFSPLLLERIGNNLEDIMDDLDKEYQYALEKYLKEKFIKAFEDILEDKTEEMLKIFYKEKNKLIEKFNVQFSSEEDNDLKEINKKINQTLESMRTYNNYIDTFEITKSVISFFTKYGNSTLLPPFLKFDKDLNNKIKQSIINTINEKSAKIEKLTISTLTSKMSAIDSYYLNKYYNFVIDELNSYGKTDISYGSNFNYARNNIYERLIGNQNEDDLVEEAKKRVESKDVEETLNILLNRINNNYKGISNLDIFIYFFTKINNYIGNLGIETKNIKEMIDKNKYNDEINSFLIGKVNTLYNFLNNYYNQTYNKFSQYKNYWMGDMSNLYSHLSTCIKVTSSVLNSEYQKIYKEIKPINTKYSKFIPKYDQIIKYESKSDHMTNYANANIFDINEYAEFKLDLLLEGTSFIRPKVKGRIVDKTKPRQVDLDIYSKCGKCCIEGHIYNITFNDTNYTTTVEYDTKTSSINITSYTNIEKYYFTEITYKKDQLEQTTNENFDTIVVNITRCSGRGNNGNNMTIYMQNTTEISAKHFNESMIITK